MKKVFLSIAAAAALASCAQKSEVADLSLVREVSIVANAADTKTLLDGNNVVWESGDAIRLRFAKDAQYYFENFATTGTGVSATFNGSLPNEVSVANGYAATGYAVYPATAMAADGTVSFTLPASIEANENGSFTSGTNLSSATVSLKNINENGTTDATFKNAFSIIRFSLNAGVTSLQITADNYIAGTATMDFQNDGRLAVDSWTSGSKVLYIEPKENTFTAGTTYNVLVYPGTYKSLSVFLTDNSGCTYEKTITGEFEFEPSEYYTFTFNTQFAKGYWFIGKGYSFTADVDKIMTVYTSNGTVLHEEELTAQANNRFEGDLPESVVKGTDVKGFAVYPSTAYNISTDKITYYLPTEVTASTTLAKLYTAYLYVGIEEAQFTSITSALSKLKFDLPENIYSVKIQSASAGIVGTTVVTVGDDGKPVVGLGDAKTVVLRPEGKSGVYTVYVYSLAGLTITYADGVGKEIVDTNPQLPSEGDGTVELPAFNFDRDGKFTNESFNKGESYDF